MAHEDWIQGTRFFTQITANDHAGWLYIITLLSIVYTSLSLVVRLVVKHGAYGWDDWSLLGATVVTVGQCGAILAACANGLGKSMVLLSDHQAAIIERYATAHAFLFVIALCASKLSTALLARRLFSIGNKRVSIYCWVVVGATLFYGIFALLLLAVECQTPAFSASSNDSCPHRLIFAADIITEAVLVIFPCVMLRQTMIQKDIKIMVLAIFSFRLLDIAFAIINMTVIGHHAPVNGLTVVPSLIWTQFDLLWSVIAASLPCLRTFMKPFDRVDEETWRANNPFSSQLSGRSWMDRKDGSVPLETIVGQNNGAVLSFSGIVARPDEVGHDVAISHDGKEAGSHTSWGSQEQIIRTETQWEVRYEL